MASTLLLLVGSNPLPNYLSACALRPSKVVLLYSDGTAGAMERLKAALSDICANNPPIKIDEPIRIDDPTCATDVKRSIAEALKGVAPEDAWLNYTGGTKVMAAHARMAFEEKGGLPAQASYLDEGSSQQLPRLRFDDGTSKALTDYPDVPLALQTILELHDIDYTPRSLKEPAPTTEDAGAILHAVLADLRHAWSSGDKKKTLAQKLYCERDRFEGKGEKKCNGKAAKAVVVPFVAEKFELSLSQPVIPTQAQLDQIPNTSARNSWFKQWYCFIGGEWLEEWVGALIGELDLTPTPEVVVGVNAKRGPKGTDFEVDIAVVRGHRTYFISCTTSVIKSLCKSKIFEIAIRSRQLGGELARAAFVCLGDQQLTQQLQDEIDDVWGATNTTKVFGARDLMAWSGHSGAPVNTTTLREWLES